MRKLPTLKDATNRLEDSIITLSGPALATIEHVTPDCQCEGKQCTKCPNVKCIGEFHRDNKKKSGLVAQCKVCVKMYHQAYIQRPTARALVKKAQQTYRRTTHGQAKERAYSQREEVKERNRKHSRVYKQRIGRERARVIERNAKLKRNYNLTPNDYQTMLERQLGLCAICGNHERRIEKQSGKLKSLAVDHCHATGLVRELLCNDCNIMLAFAHDNDEVLLKAIAYLKKHGMREGEA